MVVLSLKTFGDGCAIFILVLLFLLHFHINVLVVGLRIAVEILGLVGRGSV